MHHDAAKKGKNCQNHILNSQRAVQYPFDDQNIQQASLFRLFIMENASGRGSGVFKFFSTLLKCARLQTCITTYSPYGKNSNLIWSTFELENESL